MKINNVEKFRNEIQTAMKDAASWDWKIDTPSAMWKGGCEDYKESMVEYTQGKVVDGQYIVTSLAHPMTITNKDNGKYAILTIDEDGANFYKSEPDRYIYNGCIEADWHKNKMSFAMHLVRAISERLN